MSYFTFHINTYIFASWMDVSNMGMNFIIVDFIDV